MALKEVRVIDLSNTLSGAYAARLFGDFDAEVILAEPEEGHLLRRQAPFIDHEPGPDNSVLHAYANWNKDSITLQNDEELARLIASAHVVITTDLAPWSDSLTTALENLAPDAVHLSITPHGLTGPLASVPGNNLTHSARVGWSHINGLENEPPLQLPANQSGYIAGVAGFIAAMASLHKAGEKGQGDRIDLSEMEALALTNCPWAIVGQFKGEGEVANGPNGPRERGQSGPLYPAKDGKLNLGFGDWAQWTNALNFLDLPDLAVDPVFEPVLGRYTQELDPVKEQLGIATLKLDKWHMFHNLAKFRCISGVVQNAEELLESEHLNARGFFTETTANGKKLRAPSATAKLSQTPWTFRKPAPGLGEHGESIRAQLADSRPGANGASSNPDRKLPLDGVRVLTFTQAWSGPFATQLLGFLGADVIQVEGCQRPDVWRGAGAPVGPAVENPDIEQSPLNNNGMFNSANLNKRGITLDMTHPRGKKMFWDMVPNFDVICDNFSPHVMTKWGITLEKLHEKNKGIIFASLSAYGRTGPLSEYPGNGNTTEPMAGLASIHGYKNDEPMNTGGLIPDPVSGYHFAAAILVALNHRQRTGEGQRIDASMIESVAVQIGDAVLERSANNTIRGPQGNTHPAIAPHGTYKTGNDEWLSIAAETDAAWESLVHYMGNAELLTDSRFDSMVKRVENHEALDVIIENWSQDRDASQEEENLGALGVCAARVLPFLDVYPTPNAQWKSRDFMVPVTHPESGTHLLPRAPWAFANSDPEPLRYAPCFGEHSQEVFNQELGITEEEYLELLEQNITGTERLILS
jgi:crotonobetainyl-CoA:carnitine CoA-transferase CaiB-like acyl-CoA transferase